MTCKFYKITKHFAERLIQRVSDFKKILNKVLDYLNDHVLELVFNSVLKGKMQRFCIDGYKVYYHFDSNINKLVITTIY